MDRPPTISSDVITLLENSMVAGRNLDYYSPITLLKTLLKFLFNILTESVQLLAEILCGEDQTCAGKGLTIQTNLNLICTILEGLHDNE